MISAENVMGRTCGMFKRMGKPKERDYLEDLPIDVSVKLICLETGMKGID